MAKKSVKLGLRSGSAVESGDVNVTYNGVRIAGLSESTTATLETENTIVEHDIEIEYTKPAGGGSITVPLYILDLAASTPPAYSKDMEITVGEPHTEEIAGATGISLAYNGDPMGLHNALPYTITDNLITFLGVDPSGWEVVNNDNTVACNSIVIPISR